MKICKLCGKQFKTCATIDGKKKNLSLRTYCLECVPFGTHYSKQIDNIRKIEVSIEKNENYEQLNCKECKKDYIFSKSYRNGASRSLCASCTVKNWRKKKKQEIVDKCGGKCCVCGYNKCNNALDFHHLDPNNKSNGISYLISSNTEKLDDELKKCILLCKNCHAEIHAGLIDVERRILDLNQ